MRGGWRGIGRVYAASAQKVGLTVARRWWRSVERLGRCLWGRRLDGAGNAQAVYQGHPTTALEVGMSYKFGCRSAIGNLYEHRLQPCFTSKLHRWNAIRIVRNKNDSSSQVFCGVCRYIQSNSHIDTLLFKLRIEVCIVAVTPGWALELRLNPLNLRTPLRTANKSRAAISCSHRSDPVKCRVVPDTGWTALPL